MPEEMNNNEGDPTTTNVASDYIADSSVETPVAKKGVLTKLGSSSLGARIGRGVTAGVLAVAAVGAVYTVARHLPVQENPSTPPTIGMNTTDTTEKLPPLPKPVTHTPTGTSLPNRK